MKTILVLLDGLNANTASRTLAYLTAMCQKGFGQSYVLRCEQPSLSRPLYECILTGVAPIDSGIIHNGISRLSNQKSIFHYAKAAGLTTAAAAYYWVSELYNRTPFVAVRDRHTDDKQLLIQHGCFYYADHYPDSHLFVDGEYLRTRYQPDFLFIHSMNIDDAGHSHGQDSCEYRRAARDVDGIISNYLFSWLENGYQVIITSDHGMDNEGNHYADSDEESLVPLFVFGQAFSYKANIAVKQTEICGTLCQLLNIPHDKPYCQELLRETQI